MMSFSRIHFNHVSSPSRIHHLGSQAVRQLYFNCLLGSPTVVPLRGTSTIHIIFPFPQKWSGMGSPLMTSSYSGPS